MSLNLKSEHLTLAQKLVGKAHAHGGLAPLDIERFWEDNAVARRDPFAPDCPQVPLGIGMGTECVFAELGIEESADSLHRLHNDHEYRLALHRQYNDKAEEVVGRRLLSEAPAPDPTRQYPPVKQLYDLFEAQNVWHTDSYWLQQSARTPEELKALLDRVEARLENLRAFLLPPHWDEERSRLAALGVKPGLYRGQRGPVTFAASVYGPENLLFLFYDNPELVGRFRDLILRAMLERARILDEEAGYTPETAPRGFAFCDDNCCLLSPGMYDLFGYPILKGLFDRYSPDPGDMRGQHSDSAMGHLLPILGRLDLTWTNFGPTVMVDGIREHLPNAVIHGQLAPFTFSRNDEVGIVAEFLRDFDMARERRGLLFSTAGSINNGSRLTGLRLTMAVIQEYGRYERLSAGDREATSAARTGLSLEDTLRTMTQA
jgi:uroporphyrinogen decarboxylase